MFLGYLPVGYPDAMASIPTRAVFWGVRRVKRELCNFKIVCLG